MQLDYSTSIRFANRAKINGEWDWRQVLHTFERGKQDFYIDTNDTSRAVLDTIWRHAVYELEEGLEKGLEYVETTDKTGMPALSLAPGEIRRIKARAMSLWRHPCNDYVKRVYKELLQKPPRKPGEGGLDFMQPWIIHDEDNWWNGGRLTEIFTERCTGPGTEINHDEPREWVMPSGAVSLVDFVESLDGEVTYGMQLESGGDTVAMKAQTPEKAEEELLSAGAVMLYIHEDEEYVGLAASVPLAHFKPGVPVPGPKIFMNCMIRNMGFIPPGDKNDERADPSEDIMDP